jgi:transcriptional regulator with XRE-family HTH domain
VARDSFSDPELGPALAWLRARARLTQAEVVERVFEQQRGRPQAERETLSAVYYQLLETGKRTPRTPKLAVLLAALGSDQAELEGLLAAQPWRHVPTSKARISKHTPRPAAYALAADEALAGRVWSSPIAASPTRFAPDGEDNGTEEPVQDELRALQQRRGELSELVDHFENLSQRDRRALLGRARRLRFGASSAIE